MHWMDGWSMGWMGFGGLFFLIVIGLLIWALVRNSAGSGTAARKSPEAILKERYARGEIERDEYERRLSDLRRSPACAGVTGEESEMLRDPSTGMQIRMGVMGSAEELVEDRIGQSCRNLGRQIATKGCCLLTGACPGMPTWPF